MVAAFDDFVHQTFRMDCWSGFDWGVRRKMAGQKIRHRTVAFFINSWNRFFSFDVRNSSGFFEGNEKDRKRRKR